MGDLISREALLAGIRPVDGQDDFMACTFTTVKELFVNYINAAPAVEVKAEVVHKPTEAEFKRMAAQLGYEPVRHAHWVGSRDRTLMSPCYECSACGRKINTFAEPEVSVPFCHCGAKMDEVSE